MNRPYGRLKWTELMKRLILSSTWRGLGWLDGRRMFRRTFSGSCAGYACTMRLLPIGSRLWSGKVCPSNHRSAMLAEVLFRSMGIAVSTLSGTNIRF